jgi:N-acetyl-anhydromuramyl-L-alanine amidase AmpD
MLVIENGIVKGHPRIKLEHRLYASSISPHLHYLGPMPKVRGIIVHQTATETDAQVMNNIWNGKNKDGSVRRPDGAHFLIDKDGTIYQTALLNQQASHVGLIQARCLVKMTCTAAELPDLKRWRDNPGGGNARRTYDHEKVKPHPIRYPSNVDSIGIECVGMAYGRDKDGKLLPNQKDVPAHKKIFDPLTDEQKESLRWLIWALGQTLEVPMAEVFRHSIMGVKNKTEAISAQKLIDELQAEEAEEARKAKAAADKARAAQ